MTHNDKLRTFIYALIVAISVPILEALVVFDPAVLADPKPWLIGLGTGCVRAAAGFILANYASNFLAGRPVEVHPPRVDEVPDDYPNEGHDERI